MKENKPLKEEEKILNYLNGDLTEDDLKKNEAELDSDEFTKDALEGLVQLNQNALPNTVFKLKSDFTHISSVCLKKLTATLKYCKGAFIR